MPLPCNVQADDPSRFSEYLGIRHLPCIQRLPDAEQGGSQLGRLAPVLVALAVVSLLIAGCGGGAPAPTGTQSLSELYEILEGIPGIQSVTYDLVTTVQGNTTTMRIWMKSPDKWRTQITVGGETVVTYMDYTAGTICTSLPAKNVLYKGSLDASLKPATEDVLAIERYQPRIVGTETVDGKTCLVVEYTKEGLTIKAWLWKERGFPAIRMEATGGPLGPVVAESRNIDYSDVPDSMFQLPTGAQIIEMPKPSPVSSPGS